VTNALMNIENAILRLRTIEEGSYRSSDGPLIFADTVASTPFPCRSLSQPV